MSNHDNIPPEIKRILDQSVRRIRNIVLARGVFTVLTVSCLAMLAGWAAFFMIDDIAGWVRWIFWGISLGAILTTIWVSLVRPLLRHYEPWTIAAFIERNHPELEERLSSVVGLAAAGDADISSRLVEELTHDAVRDAGKVSPQREISTRSMRPWLIAVSVAGSIIGAIAVCFPRFAMNALIHTVNPTSEVENVFASSIAVQPEDAIVLEGQPFTVKMVATGSHLGKAFIRTRIEGGPETNERMEKEVGGTEGTASFTYSYPRVGRSFSYRLKCGGGLTRAYHVRVVPEPAYTERSIEIRHPAYTGREPDVYTNTSAVVGLPGSIVRVTFRPSSDDLSGAALLPGDRTVEAVRGADGRLACEFELGKGVEGSWGLLVWDPNGFSNKLETAAITLVSDAPPSIKLVEPEIREMKLPAFGELPLDFEIQEDFGLSRTVIEMCPGAGAWEEVETLEPRKTGGIRWSGGTTVHFAGLNFGNAAVVRFRVKAKDTLPEEMGGPGTGCSSEVTVTFVSQNTSLARQSLSQQIGESRQDLDEIRKKLESTRRSLEGARTGYAVDKNDWHLDNANRDLDKAKDSMTAAEGMLASFIGNLTDSRLETGADLFRPVMNDRFTPTRQEIEDIYLLARMQEKSVSCTRAAENVLDCLNALDDARKRFDALTKAAENLQKLEDYAAREEALSEMFLNDEIDAADLAAREEELAQKFADDFRDEINRNLDWQMKVSEDMKKRTEQLEQRQEALKEKAAQAKTEAERAALAEEERKLSRDIRNQANRLGDLARDIEARTGPVEDDSTRTVQPVKDAQEDEYKAAKEAAAAAEKVSNGDLPGAQQDMQAAADALRKAQQGLDDALGRMDEKNKELMANAADYKDMQNALNEAVAAAKAAATQQAGDQQQQQGGDQQQQQQQGGNQQQQGQAQGQQQQTPQRQAAQQAAQQAAGKIQQKAQQQAQQSNLPLDRFQPEGPSQDGPGDPNAQPDPNAQSNSGQGPEGRRKDREGERMALGMDDPGDAGAEWFKMKSDSAAGADADELGDVPEEYRGLVRDYFDALNKGGEK